MYLQYISWLALVLAIASLTVHFFTIKKQNKRMDALKQLVQSLQSSSGSFKKQFTEIHAVSMGMGKKIQQLDSVVKKTQENQLDLVAQAPENRLYTRAAKMVELGASVEELMLECELPRAEAELMINLHKK